MLFALVAGTHMLAQSSTGRIAALELVTGTLYMSVFAVEAVLIHGRLQRTARTLWIYLLTFSAATTLAWIATFLVFAFTAQLIPGT